MKDWILDTILIGLLYCLIYFSWGVQLAKKVYYVALRIPHRKIQDKFHPVYVRHMS